MEGGQKISINLEAPLDTKSSDMLVSVNDVKFAHNRQKFQGHVLPTSLRYERDGWAAGWYVYDFKIGGGYIFSVNDNTLNSKKTWLAVNRSKINATPTYVLSFHTAQNDDDNDTPDDRGTLKQYADAVSNTVQFQAWFTDTASINARECEEAEIDFMPIPTLSFNYAVEGHDYRNSIRFTPFNNTENGVEFDVDNCFTTLSPDTHHSANLSMEYVDRAADGTVTAILNNNEVRWNWQDTVYVPRDLADSEGNVFAKFVNLVNRNITWKLGNELLNYVNNAFVYNNVTYTPMSSLSVPFSIPVTYTIPLSKYYSELRNISWSVQGTRNLFNNEDGDNPLNSYRIFIDVDIDSDVTVHDGKFKDDGIDGPDVALLSELQLPIDNLPVNSGEKVYSTNGEIAESINYMDDGTPCIVPIFNTTVKDFSFTGNEDDTRDVMIQVYYKYPGQMLNDLGVVYNRQVRAAAMSYKYAAVGLYNEVVYGGEKINTPSKYLIDGKYISVGEDGFKLGTKLMWGRLADLNMSITSLNAVQLRDPLIISGKGINSNMIFNLMTEVNELTQTSTTPVYLDNYNLKRRQFALTIRNAFSWRTVNGVKYRYCIRCETVKRNNFYEITFRLSDPGYHANDNGAYSYVTDSSTGGSDVYPVDYDCATDYWPKCRLTLVNHNFELDSTQYGDESGQYYKKVFVIPLCLLGRSTAFADSILGSNDIILCALHPRPSITCDRDGYVTPRYGFCIIKGDAPYCADPSVESVSSPTNDDRTAYVDYTDSNYCKHLDFKLKSLNMYTVLGTEESGRAVNTYYAKPYELVERYSFNIAVPGQEASNQHILVQGIVTRDGNVDVNELLDIIYWDSWSAITIQEIPEDLSKSGLFPYYWSNIPFNLTRPVQPDTTYYNDTLRYLQAKTANGTYRYIKIQSEPYWASTFDAVLDIDGDNFINNLCIDIMDTKTGELLVDHTKDVITVTDTSKLSIDLRESALVKGISYFNKPVETPGMYAQKELKDIYFDSRLSGAFFPICKYKYNSQGSSSVYHNDTTFGGCQGIVVFNTAGVAEDLPTDYNMFLMSPLSSYVLPPRIDSQTGNVVVYAGKTYSHHIKFTEGIQLYNKLFIDDNSNNINNVIVSPREQEYSNDNSSPEINNKYYTGKSLLTASSVTYYNGQIHIIYKPKSGDTISFNDTIYDLGTSDMSIRQDADLVAVYLLKYTDPSDKYNLVLGEYDGLNTAETKEIINTISDKNKHWVYASITNIDFSQDRPVVTLQLNEYHDNDNNEANNDYLAPAATKTLTYNSDLQYNVPYIDTRYSDDNQLVINSDVPGTAVIHLPPMPLSDWFKYDVAGNEISVVDMQNSANHFKYNCASNKVTEMYIGNKLLARATVNLVSYENEGTLTQYVLSVNQNINSYVYFKHYGIYKFAGLTTDSITPKVKELSYSQNNKREITFKVSDFAMRIGAESTAVGINVPFTVNLNHFDDATECTPKYLDYSATDVRDDNEDTKTKYFARVMADSEYQLVKQHWDSTVATENFWWIDPEHTMKLTKDRFIVEKKLDELDPWNGNKWQKVHEYERTDYLTSEADTCIYSSASGRNAHCYLYILSPETETSIKVKIYNPLVSTEVVKDNRTVERMQLDSEFTIEFKHIALGKQLNEHTAFSNEVFTLCTYSDILSTSLLADSKLSAVEINGTHYIGIQYDKNFNQWTLAFGNTVSILHGYGCVGINGYATGGMLPVKYFTNGKFNSTVHDVNKLEAEEDLTLSSLDDFNIFNERIVGDENQQWYISEELSDIVMAVSLKDGNLIKLPITNKYSQVYSSPSYVKYTVHALGIQIKQLVNLFGDDENPIWKEIIKYAMFPLVWYLSPYTNVINYLQQTLGQYAYVHYNSTSIGKQGSKEHSQITDDNAGLSEDESANYMDALVTDDLSFDVQHIPQEQSFRDSTWDNVLGIFASMVVSATDYTMRDLTVNSLQNQSAVNDIGKKFSQAFLQNIGSMSVTGFNMQSTKPMLKSEVTAVKTLDMFYSTSAQQNCYAGPGYVNMQFVAQCTAQSVTSVQLEAQQTQMFMLLKQLTTWQGKATMYVLDLLKDFMFKMADVMGGGPSAGVVVGLGWIGAIVTAGVGYALIAAKALVKLGLETVDNMLDSFFPGGIKSNVTAQLSRHNYDIEGKHAYGNKSECFMWPCADAKSKVYTDESVEATLQDKFWPLEMPKATSGNTQFKPIYSNQPDNVTIVPDLLENEDWEGKVPYSIAMCKGLQKRRTLPDSTAFVIGTESFMPTVPFKNENIGEGEPVFTPPPVQDYIIDKNWNLFVTAMAGDALWVSCKDTKLFDGNYSNIVVTDSFCGIAAPHVAVEIKRDISAEYLRPWAVSPDAIALNITGLNCAYDEVAYHAFDGYGYRITDWLGSSGMNKEHYTLQYCFQINDRFKRSNKLPPNQFLGNFQAVPSMSLDVKDKVFNDIQVTTEERGMRTGVAGENKDTQRYSLPIFTEQISSLPAIVRALSPYKLAVIDGITSLTTDIRSSQSAYKVPDSVDFNINDKLYRMTNEYICSVDHEKGLEVVKYLVPALGLTYLGATPFMAYFYNQATRQYYIYQGGNTLQVMDMLERFRDIKSGTYDFINQEVVMPCLATMTRLDKKVKDDADETDNIVIPVFRHNKVGGELTPPTDVIFNTDSWYRTVSIPAGLVFQGPNRCIINRFVWSQYMLKDIKDNKGKWVKVPREEYHPFRKYGKKFNSIAERVHEPGVVRGWTHNPFLLVTSPLGVQEEVDCKFEWEITFAWTVEMEQLYADNEYVTVNVMAETMTPGGKVFNRPTHIYLHKELFTRSGNFGYYSFRYQGNNGMGNRERLHIWSDGYIAISSLQLEYKTMTEKRNEVLVIQEDLKGMKEM